MIATTIEQSKKLLELGLSPESADMYRWEYNGQWFISPLAEGGFNVGSTTDELCWSLPALLELMPNFIVSHDTAFEDEDAEGISTTYYKHLEINNKSIWECSYKDDGILSRFKADTPIEAAYSMVVWLIEQGYIKTEKK